ncbi:hypothetical protein BCR44DRAFT_40964, partial [Catenaria anguillulae PL171]
MSEVTILCKASGDRARIEFKNDVMHDTAQAPLLNSSVAKPVDPGSDGNTGFSPIYDPVAALAAVQAGTHYFHAVYEMIQSGKNRSHTGGLWLHCVPRSGKFEMPENSHAIMYVSRTSDNNLMVNFTPVVRANLLSLIVASKERQEAIKKATKKAKKDPSVIVPPPIDVPPVPPTVRPLQLTCSRGSQFKRVHFLLTIRGHRILFLEPPNTTSYINRPLEWEARLLYPNYPLDNKPAGQSSGVQVTPVGTHVGEPVEGTHYTLLIRHSDNKNCCCGCCCSCFGSAGGNGNAKVKMSILSTLANTPAPLASGSASVIDDATAVELTLAVLAMIPGINSRIATRKSFVLFLGPIGLASFILFVINVVLAMRRL